MTDLHLGHPGMDHDHRVVAELVEAFAQRCEEGSAPEIIEDHLAEIIATTAHQFESENRLMESSSYPGIDEHVAVHHALLIQLRSLKILIGQGLMDVGPTTTDFVRRWLAGHILTYDRAFAEFLTAPSPAEMTSERAGEHP